LFFNFQVWCLSQHFGLGHSAMTPLETQNPAQKSCLGPEPPCRTCWQMQDDLCRYCSEGQTIIISWRMPSRMRERICEMSYSSLSSQKPQVLVCNFANRLDETCIGLGCRKKGKREREMGRAHDCEDPGFCMAAPWVPLAEREADR
jgi:hypothetical protein